MIEAWQTPIIKAALEFLFDTGKVMVKEIIERRKQTNLPVEAEAISTVSESDAIFQSVSTQDDALKISLNEALVQQELDEIEHLLKLSSIYTQNYRLTKEQYAAWGSAMVPPIIVYQLKEAEDNFSRVNVQLKSLVEKVLNRHIDIKYD